MRYVDGFVLAVPKRNTVAYRRLAKKAGKIWKEHGALEYFECAGDDLKHKGVVTFPKQMRLKAGENVFFSFIVYKSRRDRDRVNKKVMKDPRIARMAPSTMPFDMKRMVYGGFKALVDL
jgi:uncharacterized protein YbaA (DUF1428 family)